MRRLAVLLLVVLPVARALTRNDYAETYSGDGTYYGETDAGNCAIRAPIPDMYKGMVPVAINNAQYGDSGACGACLLITGSGNGLGANPIKGTYKAYVSDRCPECKHGDVDFSMSGDGRWHVKWKFIPCPGDNLFFLFEGSNSFYWKLQPRGTKTPIQKVSVNGITGLRSQDNFFVLQNGAGFKLPATVVMTDTMGGTMRAVVKYFKPDGPVYPASVSGRGGGGGGGGGGGSGGGGGGSGGGRPPPPTRPPPTKPARRCVPSWKACTGPKNFWKTSNCCRKDFRCVWPTNKPGFRGKRCEPKKRRRPAPRGKKCVPNWKACTGPDNRWGTRRCCGGYVCRKPWRKGFRGKRCVPKRR